VLSSIIGFLITISILVFIHEYGHYYVAKKCGVKILDFSIGFGKALFSWKDKYGTNWKISAIPLGGYVKMFGDQSAASNPNNALLAQLTEEEKRQTFTFQPLRNRALIVAAGPAANYLLAIVILAGFYLFYGKQDILPIVGRVMENSAAARAGIVAGDKILEINNKPVSSFNDIALIVSLRPEQQLDVKFERQEEVKKISLVSGAREILDARGKVVSKVGLLGIEASKEKIAIKYGLFESVNAALTDIWDISAASLTALGQIITGKRSSSELRGTLTIASQSGESLQQGPEEFLLFIALLSINLGLINLMPIPALDGGHLLFNLCEAIAGRPLSIKFQNYGYRIGFSLIIFLFVISTSNDIKAILF